MLAVTPRERLEDVHLLTLQVAEVSDSGQVTWQVEKDEPEIWNRAAGTIIPCIWKGRPGPPACPITTGRGIIVRSSRSAEKTAAWWCGRNREVTVDETDR